MAEVRFLLLCALFAIVLPAFQLRVTATEAQVSSVSCVRAFRLKLRVFLLLML